MKKNYKVTFGYKAVISVNVKGESEAEARKEATSVFDNLRKRLTTKNTNIEDDTFRANGDGVECISETWDEL